ncbi:hypothetical protein [Leeia aquatica]|uniref:Lysis protein n=1 Tax=Leeia aquatica TaxID=2725557 RepID=A0A847SA31_9NEIS|nr:hypothetical protein [Leeia aquatica]NLR74199.1 hypothetical protein [Leeia aquatica]
MIAMFFPWLLRHWRGLAGVVLLLLAGWAGHAWSERRWQARWAEQQALLAQQAALATRRNAEQARRQSEAATYALQDQAHRLQQRVAATQTRILLEKRYEMDAAGRVRLPARWVYLYNAAIRRDVPRLDGAGGSDGPTQGLDAFTAVQTINRNTDACHDNADQLMALQAYLQRAGVVVQP